MRTYAGLLLFEDIFDFVPTGVPLITNLANSLFSPNVLIVENDCHTTLGIFIVVNFEAEGLIETATGIPLSSDRITELLSEGIYSISTRHVNNCVSKGGVCAKCYNSTYQDQPAPSVLDRVTVHPEYTMKVDNLYNVTTDIPYPLATLSTQYNKALVYVEGVLLNENVDYHIDPIANTIILYSHTSVGYWNGIVTTLKNVPYTGGGFWNGIVTVFESLRSNFVFNTGSKYSVTIRYINADTSPFLTWLSNTYSGSVLGIKPLISQPLPLPSLLLTSFLTQNELQLADSFIKTISSIPVDYTNYIDQIKDPLEQALYILVLYCIYSNVST